MLPYNQRDSRGHCWGENHLLLCGDALPQTTEDRVDESYGEMADETYEVLWIIYLSRIPEYYARYNWYKLFKDYSAEAYLVEERDLCSELLLMFMI